MKRLTFVVVFASVCLITGLYAQQPSFRAGVDIVSLNVTVTDPQGRYVTDIGQDEFSVFEDGAKQDLTYFNRTNLPIALSLLIDSSASMEQRMENAQDAAIGFAKKLRPQAHRGDFLLPRDPGAPVLLIAAGIGITPFLSQLASGGERDTVVLYLARSRAELAACEQLEKSGARVVARLADGSAPPEFMDDAGTPRIDARRLQELVPDIRDRAVYISGSPKNVQDLRAVARAAGARKIHVVSFAGY